MKAQLYLLRYARPHWRAILTVIFLMGIAVGLDVLRPWPTKILVDDVLGQQRLPHWASTFLSRLPGPSGRDGLLLWVCVSTVLLFLSQTLISMLRTWIEIGFGQRMTYELGADLFLHLQRLSILFHSRTPVGDTSTRITGDAYCVQVFVSDALLPLLQASVELVAMFAIMWQLNSTITLLSLGVIPFLLLSIHIFQGPMRGRSRIRRDLEGQMMSMVEQALSAIPAIQAFTREETEYRRFQRCAGETVTAYQRTTVAQMWFRLCVGLVTALGTAGLMWLGGRDALHGILTIGTILVFLSYLSSLYEPLNTLAYLASTVQTSAANADRVLEILRTSPEVKDASDAIDLPLHGSVRYENVAFGYEPGRPVLKNISFEVRPGETVAIVGPTGAGKTTLLNLLVRFFDPWSGQILVDDCDIRRLRLKSLRQQIAMVLQEPFIFPTSIAENIAYGCPDAAFTSIEQAAVAARADDFIRRMPEGYESIVGERGATLSGGEKQRLSIARAFLKDARILVLDEPTSALDAHTEAFLLEALDRLMQGRTTFVIAHRLSTIRGADRILVLDHGDIVEQGKHDELIARNGLYAALYRQQMEIARHEPIPPGDDGLVALPRLGEDDFRPTEVAAADRGAKDA